MNNVILIGRLTADPEIRYTKAEKPLCIATYSLAVQRNTEEADFIRCVSMGKVGELTEKYLRKGTKVAVHGSIRTSSYTDREGKKVYTTDVYVYTCEFLESKKSASKPNEPTQHDLEELPFIVG